MLEYKVFITRKMVVSDDDTSLHRAEGARIHNSLKAADVLGVFILASEFTLTVDRVKRLERLLGSVWGEKVTVIY